MIFGNKSCELSTVTSFSHQPQCGYDIPIFGYSNTAAEQICAFSKLVLAKYTHIHISEYIYSKHRKRIRNIHYLNMHNT